MKDISEAYDLSLEGWSSLCRRLNRRVYFPGGVETSAGIIYWVREAHYNRLDAALESFQSAGMQHISELAVVLRTPKRVQEMTARLGVAGEILRILKHDIGMWLPAAVSLAETELHQHFPGEIAALADAGIQNQLEMISNCQTPAERDVLASRTGIEIRTVGEITRWCDFRRTGKNLDHIRTRIYYEMGLDTWQKWAVSTPQAIISRFAEYIHRQGMEETRLVPFPKEVCNGIEWAKLHLSIYEVEWSHQ